MEPTKFKNFLADFDKLLNRGSEEVSQHYSFRASDLLSLPGKVYKVPGLVMEMYEPDPDAVRELPKDLSFRVNIHNHPVGNCPTPKFCFELGFDPTVLPLKVRKNFMAVNVRYFEAPKIIHSETSFTLDLGAVAK